MLDTKAYMEWLEKFTLKHKSFEDFNWWRKDLSYEDKENVSKLREFFNEVAKYAKKNSVAPVSDDCGYHYCIKYNGNDYLIGVTYTWTSYFYCKKAKIPSKASFLRFPFVGNNGLDLLAEVVEELLDSDIPIDTIADTINNVIAKHKTKS